jgi:integral membrane protein (TIGR01906 family)
MKHMCRACVFLGSLAAMICAALFIFESAALDANVYVNLQDQLSVYGYAGVGRDELALVMDDFAAYLRGEYEECPNREVTMFGESSPILNDKEIAHMRDVRALFGHERVLRGWLLGLSIALMGAAFALYRKAGGVKVKRMPLYAFLCLIAPIVAFAIWVEQDFYAVFNQFHEAVFTNDLWLLNPETDALIRMFPLHFFTGIMELMLKRLMWLALAALIAYLIAVTAMHISQKKRRA